MAVGNQPTDNIDKTTEISFFLDPKDQASALFMGKM